MPLLRPISCLSSASLVKHLALVKNHLTAKKIPLPTWTAPARHRKDQVAMFNKDKKVKVFLIHHPGGRQPNNLTEADYVFILDPWWRPGRGGTGRGQGAPHRPEKKVFTYKFVARNSVEEKIFETAEKQTPPVGKPDYDRRKRDQGHLHARILKC